MGTVAPVPAVIHQAGLNPEANLRFEEALFNQLREKPRPLLLTYICAPCIVLGRNNNSAEWAYAERAAMDGVPVLRRFSGGGAVYLDQHVLNYSLMLPRARLDALARSGGACMPTQPQAYINACCALVVRALDRGGSGYARTGISDISLNGRKIGGCAQRIASTLVLHHGTLMLRCPLAQIERYLPVPPNRPGIPHAQFVTGLYEQGRAIAPARLIAWLAAELAAMWNAG